MLSSVLKSDSAIGINIAIMRAFVTIRRAAETHADLRAQLQRIEVQLTARLDRHDDKIEAIFTALKELADEEESKSAIQYALSGKSRIVAGLE